METDWKSLIQTCYYSNAWIFMARKSDHGILIVLRRPTVPPYDHGGRGLSRFLRYKCLFLADISGFGVLILYHLNIN